MDFDRLRRRRRLPSKLIFDTANSPGASGTRRREATSRHLLYEIEKLCLDLRVDRAQQSTQAVVVGQLADREDPLKPLTGLSVFLLSGEAILTRSVSNRQGEFRMEYDTDDAVSLCLSLDSEKLIEVPVDPRAGDDQSSEA